MRKGETLSSDPVSAGSGWVLTWLPSTYQRIWTRAHNPHPGRDVMLDQWGGVPGDQLPEFMEHSLREHDFILIICTPQYERKSDGRIGGVLSHILPKPHLYS